MSSGMIIFLSTLIKGVLLTLWEDWKKRRAERKGVVLPPTTHIGPMKLARRVR